MYSATYRLNPLHGLLTTSSSTNSLVMDAEVVHDANWQKKNLQLQALIKSGDYFAALATELDSVCAEVQDKDAAVVDLQRIIRDLLFIQSEYQIIKK